MIIRRAVLAHAGLCIVLSCGGTARADVISIFAQRAWQCEVRVRISERVGTASVSSNCSRIATVRVVAGAGDPVDAKDARWVRYVATPGEELRRLGDSRPNIQAQRLGANVVASIAY